MRNATRVLHDRLPRSAMVLGIVISLFWAAGLSTALIADPTRYNDSGGYVVGSGGLDYGVLSLVGNSLRAWPTVAVFGLVDGDSSRTLVQSILYLAAWSLLMWAFLARTTPVTAAITGSLVGLFALAPVVFEWNTIILSESVTISLTIAGIGMSRLALDSGRAAAYWMWSGLLALSLAAVNKLPLGAILVAVLIVHGLNACGALDGEPTRGPKDIRRPVAIISIVAAAILMLYPLVVNASIDRTWAREGSDGTSRNAVNYYFLTSADVDSPLSGPAAGFGSRAVASADRLHAALPDDAPACLKASRATTATLPQPFQRELAATCPDGVAWVNANFIPWYATFLLTHPDYVVNVLAYRMALSLTSDPHVELVSMIPPALAQLFSEAEIGGVLYLPLAIWFLVGLASCIAAIVRLARSARDAVGALLVAAFIGSLIAWCVTLLMMSAELQRISVVAIAPLIASSILLPQWLWSSSKHDSGVGGDERVAPS